MLVVLLFIKVAQASLLPLQRDMVRTIPVTMTCGVRWLKKRKLSFTICGKSVIVFFPCTFSLVYIAGKLLNRRTTSFTSIWAMSPGVLRAFLANTPMLTIMASPNKYPGWIPGWYLLRSQGDLFRALLLATCFALLGHLIWHVACWTELGTLSKTWLKTALAFSCHVLENLRRF